ncbi:FAD-dependent oxidoreductase [Streptomyces echinatus]|uniref:2-polyprenyl-6-methoxyphenol hydroxylase-like FAD-dependent oxidoreductase n=1 Tax=Streptomyces echinatus TaxID=67293 RepID=A0A7W9Q3C7_9ACTN|nr:monooxygenase [Streptomyces echinatus]MBB5932825.1 2-polyprenyl-6-methoxyphenol hydroxylase-like FAD-dependent oxidoreductase [Streptomyces echinatus]
MPGGTRGGRAVVIGAGVAGLAAARVLADHFEAVTVLERDTLESGAAVRPGVPQGHHVHGLLALGAEVLEGCFPGLRAELEQAGAPVWDWGEGLCAVLPKGTPAPLPMGMPIQTFSRPLLERVLRGRVTALGSVTLRDGLAVTGLRTAAPGKATGVLVKGSDGEDEVVADLVVDASGRSSHLPQWLAGLGLPSPRITTVDAQIGYASRTYTYPAGQPRPSWMGLLEPLRAPDVRKGCYAIRIENNALHVTLHGGGGTQLPRDDEAFLAFAKTLRGPIADTIACLTPTSPVRRYARTLNRKTAYHRLPRWPEGLIALGDSVCTFNPAYGQGMTVAALEARLLEQMLRSRRDGTPFDGHGFQKRLARVTAFSWLMATVPDRAWKRPGPALPVKAGNCFLDRLIDTVPYDPRTYTTFSQLFHMTAGPLALADPRLLSRVLIGPRPSPNRPAATA